MPVSFDEILSQQRDAEKKKGGAAENQTVEPLPRRKPAPKDETVVEAPAVEEVSSDDIVEEDVSSDASAEVVPEYRESTSLEHQMSPGGGKSGGNKPKKKRIVGESVQIRDFPRELMSFVRAEFPSANNNTDALAAYIYVKLGNKVDVSDDIKDLAKTYNGDKTVQNLAQRTANLERTINEMKKQNDELLLLLSYIAFDRLGYRKEQAKSPREVNLLEAGVRDLMRRVTEQADIKRKEDAVSGGRPIR